MRVYRCANRSVGPSLSLPFVMLRLPPYNEKTFTGQQAETAVQLPCFYYTLWNRGVSNQIPRRPPLSCAQGALMREGRRQPAYPLWKCRLRCATLYQKECPAFFLSGGRAFENSRMGLVLPVGRHGFLEQTGGRRRRPGNGVSACLNGFPNELLCGAAGRD